MTAEASKAADPGAASDAPTDAPGPAGGPAGGPAVAVAGDVAANDAPPPSPTILVADDDPVSLRLLHAVLTKWGHKVVVAHDGEEAWSRIQEGGVRLAVIDWMMPRLDGPGVCRRVRAAALPGYLYLMLLTARQDKADLIEGLHAGADDYLTKPFDPRELEVRLKVGLRTLALEDRLAQRISELEDALHKIKELEGLLPICAYCKKVRDDTNYWQSVEGYVSARTKARFSHSVCPTCFEKFVKPELESLEAAPVGTTPGGA